MAYKKGSLCYTLATIASVCFISGLLVLTAGGETNYGTSREINTHD